MFPASNISNSKNNPAWHAVDSAKNEGSLEANPSQSILEKIKGDFKSFPQKLKQSSLVNPLKKSHLFISLSDVNSNSFTGLHLGRRAFETGREHISVRDAVGWSKLVIDELQNPESEQHLLKVPGAKELLAPIDQLQALNEQGEMLAWAAKMKPTEEGVYLLIQAKAEEIAESVKNLGIGESYFMPGGYSASPAGHAMYYRFTREKDNTYRIVLYNAGEGALWQGFRESEHQDRLIPFVVYSKVSHEQLFFSSTSEGPRPGLFQSLIEMQILPSVYPVDPRFKFEISDVWKAFAHIQHKMSDPSLYHKSFMTAQAVGNCALKSLQALLRDLIQDEKVFKSYKLNSLLLSLVNFYHAHASNLEKDEKDMHRVRYQLREAALNLCQKLDLYSEGTNKDYPEISEEQLTKFYATALDIIERVDEADQKANEASKRTCELSATAPFCEIDIDSSGLKSCIRVSDSRKKDISTPVNELYKLIPPEKLFEELNLLYDLTAYDKTKLDRKQRIAEIETFFSLLPVPQRYPDDPYWSQVKWFSPTRAWRISRIFDTYITLSTKEAPLHTPEQYNTVMHALAMMHQLCWQYDAKPKGDGLLQDFSLGEEYSESLYLMDPFLISTDPAVWERGQKLLSYFRSVKKPGKEIFSYCTERNVTSDRFKPELDFYASILKKYPDYCEKMKREHLIKLQNDWHLLKLSDLELLSLMGLWDFGDKMYDTFPLLEETGHHRICYLKRMVVDSLVGIGLGQDTEKTQFSEYAVGADNPGKFSIYRKSHKKVLAANRSAPADFLHRGKYGWKKDIAQEFSKPYLQPYLERSPEKVQGFDQAAHLQASIAQTDEEKSLTFLASVVCEPKSAVATLLYRLLENVAIAENPKAQALIRILLFKPYFPGGTADPVIPLFEDLKDRPEETLHLFQQVIEKGLQQQFYLRSPENVNVSAVLYFIRLGQQISRSYSQIHPGKKQPLTLYPEGFLDKLEAMLRKRTPLPMPLLAAVSLHQMQELMSEPSESWTNERWSAIYGRWLAICSLGNISRQPEIDRTLYQEVEQQMRMLEPILKKKTQSNRLFTGGFLIKTMYELGLKGDFETSWFKRKACRTKPLSTPKEKFSWQTMGEQSLTFAVQFEHKAKVSINFSTGKIHSDQGFLTVGRVDGETEDFGRVFGERDLMMMGFGKSLQFTDELYGECRILDEENGQKIQRKVRNNWFTYISPGSIDALTFFPSALMGGYCHWEGFDAASGQKIMLISDQKSGRTCWIVDENGKIKATGSESREYLGMMDRETFSQWEDAAYILPWVDKNSDITRIEFKRYKTESGNHLSFFCKENRWLYHNDPCYRLEIPAQDLYLGNFQHFISLVHEDGKKRKLLVPNQDIEGLSLSTRPNMPHGYRHKWQDQDRIYSYFEFRIVEGEPVADTLEGWLMLSQIFLAQKDYERAIRCLNKVTLSEEITPLARTLFKEILAGGLNFSDHSPNACALRLKAFWLVKKLDPFTSGYRSLGDWNMASHREVNDIYKQYLKGLNHVYQPLRISVDVEKELIEMLDSEESQDKHLFTRRMKFLNTGSYAYVPFVEKAFASSPEPQNDLKRCLVNTIGARDPEEIKDPQWDGRLKTLSLLSGVESFKYYDEEFLYYYQILKTGSDAERRELIYRLQWRWRECKNRGENNLSNERFQSEEDYLHFVYQHPELAPEPIDRSTADDEKIDWFYRLVKAYKEHPKDYSLERTYSAPFSRRYDPERVLHFEERTTMGLVPPLPVSPQNQGARIETGAVEVNLEESLSQLRHELLETKKDALSEVGKKMAYKLALDPKELNESELPFQKVIEGQFDAFNQELQDGSVRKVEDLAPPFKKEKVASCKIKLQELERKANEECEKLETEILSITRRLPLDEKARLQASLAKTGFVKQEVTLMDLARAAAAGHLGDYQKLLPILDQEEIKELHQLVVKYLAAKTSHDQMKAALAPLEKREKSSISEAEKAALLQESAAALSAERQYVPHENLQALYFEYASRLRLRKDQARLFKQVVELIFKKGTIADKGFVFQLIQAGGKSSVMLSRLMELAAEKGYLSILVCHHSQLSSAQGNMKKYQRERFEKNVILLNYPSHELEKLSILGHIEKTLKEVEKNKDALVVNSSMVQFLQLQLLTLLKQRKEFNEEGGQDTADAKIVCLQRINSHLLENGVGMFDEVDLTLDIHQQANSPNGPRRFLEREKLSLVHKIFKILSLPEIDKVVQLSNNEQKNLSEKEYWKTVVPAIAQKLSSELKLPTAHKGAFSRYLCNEIDVEIEKLALGRPSKRDPEKLNAEETQNLSFLKHLHQTLHLSSDQANAEAAQLIALARGIVGKILPVTLKKSFNKDYGIDPHRREQIIPYLAVDVPAETEFGHVYEHLCYMFQSAMNAPITTGAFEKYVESMTELANRYVRQGEIFEETAEAEQFFKLTGVKLAEAFQGDNLKKVAEAINQTQGQRLDFQAEMAARYVTYYESFFGSSPLALVDQFKTSVGCSGTVSNASSYNPRISRLLPDKGAEGKIISTLLDRFEGGNREASIVDLDHLQTFLQQSLDPLPDERTHCLIDGGGLLKRFSSQEVAREILNYYQKKDKNRRIKGVVFYLRQQDPSNPKVIKESFALLKSGSDTPITLANTTKEEIEKHGLKIESLFFSLDELRATGSDVPMPADACGAGTASADNLRAIGQMVMRMRKLFTGQNLDIVVTESTEKVLIGNSRKMIDIIRTALKNQAIHKANETFRSFKEQIPNLFRTSLMKLLLKQKPEKAADFVEAFSHFFETKFEDQPLMQFGFLDEEGASFDILEEIGKDQLKKFDQCLESSPAVLDKKLAAEIRQKISNEIEELVLEAKTLPELNCLFSKTSAPHLGLQMQRAVNVEQNNQLRVALQLKEEMRRYDAKNKGEPFKEVPWNSKGIDPWNPYLIGPELSSVSSLLQDCDRGDEWAKKKGLYQTDYSGCFPSNLKMTENLRQTLDVVLPIFHPLQKPAEQLLLRQLADGRIEAIMLSQKDLAFWLQRGETPKGIWLINAEGALLMKGAAPLPKKKKASFWNEVEEALWYVNFFNGNVAALERRPFLTQALFDNSKAPMHRFLYLRTAHQPGQRKVLEQSSLFAVNKNEAPANNIRYAREREKRIEVEKKNEEEIDALLPELASLVPSEKVQFLKKPEQIRRLLPHQINQIQPDQADSLLSRQVPYLEKPELIQALKEPSLIKNVPKERVHHLSASQLIHHPLRVIEEKDSAKIQEITDPELISQFGPEQVKKITSAQVPYIDTKYVSHLQKPEQIQILRGRNQINAIDSSALKHLTEAQLYELRDPALIGQVPRESIKHLHPTAIPFLDIKTQLPYLEPSQYAYIGKEQYQKIGEKEVPENLKALWVIICPEALKVYEQILQQVWGVLTGSMPGMTPWQYLLELMAQLKAEDFDEVKKLTYSGNEKIPGTPPPVMFRCKNLTKLEFSICDLCSFETGELSLHQLFPELQELTFCNCALKHVPPSIRELKKLKNLDFSKNSIERLPDWIEELKTLERLDVYKNKLKEVPPGIGKLTSLIYLGFDHNELTSLPHEIGKLINLGSILLNDNQLKELPDSIGELKKLVQLLIYNNKLTTLPASMGSMQITMIQAANNCITTLPPESRIPQDLIPIGLASRNKLLEFLSEDLNLS